MKTCVIFHNQDLDGWMSAAIVKHWFKDRFQMKGLREQCDSFNDTISFIGYNYGQPMPNLSEYDKVIMCDVSFPKEAMLKLTKEKQSNFIWIDHHQRTINETIQYIFENNVTEPSGFRTKEQLEAACELTWKYFFLNEEMPEIVRLLGRYDCFGHKGTDEEKKVLEFQYGARQVITNYIDAYDYLTHIDRDIWYDIYLKGGIIYQYLCTEAKQTYRNGFEIYFEPEYIPRRRKFICINKERFNPINFGIDYHKDGYDGAACFHYANGMWNFSIYNDNGLVDCSVIAKQYGGGGHFSAAGMIVDTQTMLKIIGND
jgi:oligoribonuclease NrnB/cAMP/cGMP phosphodiesterase (DHH superfamily)